MNDRNSKTTLILDWFNVTYRSVVLVVSTVLIVGGTAAGYWYYTAKIQPKASASREIAEATSRYAEASKLAGDSRVEQAKANALVALDEATNAFDRGAFRDAVPAAIRSRNLSLQAIELVTGGDRSGTFVTFARIEGDVKVKLAGEFAWTAADPKMPLREGDQIKTSSTSSAQILYFDGTKSTIGPGSLLEIRDLEEDPVTKVRRVREHLNWGKLEASTQDGNVRGSEHVVATEVATAIATEAGEYSVSHDKETKRTAFSTFGGAALEVASGSARSSLGAGERIVANRDGSLSAKEALPDGPRLIAPQDQKVFVAEVDGGKEVALSWEKISGARRYRLMISENTLFTRPLYDAERTDESAILADTPPGSFYWRVAAITAAGVEGPFSEVRRFRVTDRRIRDRGDNTPPTLEITDAVLTGNVLIVNGRTEPGAVLWIDNEKNEVYEDGTFYAVIRLRKEGTNQVLFVAQDASGNERRVTYRAYVETY